MYARRLGRELAAEVITAAAAIVALTVAGGVDGVGAVVQVLLPRMSESLGILSPYWSYPLSFSVFRPTSLRGSNVCRLILFVCVMDGQMNKYLVAGTE